MEASRDSSAMRFSQSLSGVAVCVLSMAANSAQAQMTGESVSSGIPYLAPRYEQVSTVGLPPLPYADRGTPPEPGFRPDFAMTELPLRGRHQDCICGKRSFVRKVLRKKCRVHPDIPPTFVPNPYQEKPHGAQVYEILNTQVRNHDATRQILNHYDFVDDTDELNFAGKRKLMRIAQGSQSNFAPIVVEATPRQPGLDTSRRERLTQEIVALGLPIPPERVIVGQSYQPGLRGTEAMVLYPGSLQHLMQGGGGGGGGGGINNSGMMGTAGMGGGSTGGTSSGGSMGGGSLGGGSGF